MQDITVTLHHSPVTSIAFRQQSEELVLTFDDAGKVSKEIAELLELLEERGMAKSTHDDNTLTLKLSNDLPPDWTSERKFSTTVGNVLHFAQGLKLLGNAQLKKIQNETGIKLHFIGEDRIELKPEGLIVGAGIYPDSHKIKFDLSIAQKGDDMDAHLEDMETFAKTLTAIAKHFNGTDEQIPQSRCIYDRDEATIHFKGSINFSDAVNYTFRALKNAGLLTAAEVVSLGRQLTNAQERSAA